MRFRSDAHFPSKEFNNHDEDGEWRKVTRRRYFPQKSVGRSKLSDFVKVVDVYIAFKRTKKGYRFGFVRFINMGDVIEFEKRLNNIMIGDVAMVINSVKFSKVGGMGIPASEFHPISYLGNYQIPKTTKTMYDHSFKEAVTCTKTPMHSTHVNINIKEDSFIRSKLECCWSGKAKNIHVLQNAWDIMANNGLDDCKLKYEDKGEICGRLMWLVIEGLPTLARNLDSVKLIANRFAPYAIINTLESIRRRFFLGFKKDQRGISWVIWDTILLDFDKGGLGDGSLEAKNLGLLEK
ncbi:nucleotide-binding alpha-beta plait domain-containing protein [Tanacetum coccineum]